MALDLTFTSNLTSSTGRQITRGVKFFSSTGESINIYLRDSQSATNYDRTATPSGSSTVQFSGVVGNFAWSGLSAANPSVLAVLTPLPNNRFTYGFTIATRTQYPLTWGLPDDVTITINHTTSSGVSPSHTLDPLEIHIAADGSVTYNDPHNPAPPPPVNPFERFCGKNIQVPFYVDGNANNVQIKIGDQVYNFPVSHEDGDSGGVAMLDLPIPQGWDGMVDVNGQPVNLGARTVYTGDPHMEFYAFAQGDRNEATLPAGMSYGVLDLPPGMVVGDSIPLPPAVVALNPSTAGLVNNALPVSVTNTSGVTSYTTTRPATPGTVVTVGNGANTAVVGSGTTGVESHDQAIVDSNLPSDVDADAAPPALANLDATWQALKLSVQSRIGGFAPLSQGSLPRATNLQFNVPLPSSFGGTKSINIPLDEQPFPTARALSLVLVSMHAGFFFIRYVRV
jgi:hypothetical protein